LEASGEAEALRRAPARVVLTPAAPPPVGLRAGSDARWLARLGGGDDKVRAALTWAAERGGVQLGLQLGVGFAPFWWGRGYYGEGRRWLVPAARGRPSSTESLQPSATRDTPDDAPAVLRVWALWWLAKIAGNQDDIAPAREWAR